MRGINVGGANRLSMEKLREVARSIGFEDVETCIQSGNLVLTADPGAPEAVLSNRLQDAIAANAGSLVAVIMRGANDFIGVPDRHPSSGMGFDEKLLHVMFLRDTPTSGQIDRLSEISFGVDTWTVTGRELYVTYPNGSARSKLTVNEVEGALETAATARNLKTIRRIAAIASRP
jgi:uncharacterized protein (DUF1697 family)